MLLQFVLPIIAPAAQMSTFSSSSSESGPVHWANLKSGSMDPPQTKWRTGEQERIYSRRLVEALRTSPGAGAAAVKEAADSALALTARGQSRWSRAILAGRIRRRRKQLLVKAGGRIRRRRKPISPEKPIEPAMVRMGEVRERLKALGRLVPGCRRLPAKSLLEEAADYVAALELQVRAMRALADALTSARIAAAAAAAPAEER